MMFKIGDKVIVKHGGPYVWPDARYVAGKTGIVIQDNTHLDKSYTLSFENWTDGHGEHHREWCVRIEDIAGYVESVKINAPMVLPADATERKKIPLGTGVLDYFPAALAEVAKISYAGNQQHNPGEPLHWARGKSTDQADTMLRHFLERGTLDSDGQRHSAKMVWRALAILQLELEAEGYPVARGAKQ
jgi:hypothetical protein